MKRWRPVHGVSLLLWVLFLVALTVGALVVAAEISEGWAVALACVVLVAATVAVAIVVQSFLRDEADAEPAHARARMRMRWSALAVVAIVAAALIVAVVAPSDDDVAAATSSDTAAAATQTVRDFLVAAYVEGDGESACGYLSLGEQAQVAVSGPSTTCRDVLNDPSGPVQLAALTGTRQVRALRPGVQVSGGAVTVRLGGGVFVLRPATPVELAQFGAPPSYWRIASGVPALLEAR